MTISKKYSVLTLFEDEIELGQELLVNVSTILPYDQCAFRKVLDSLDRQDYY